MSNTNKIQLYLFLLVISSSAVICETDHSVLDRSCVSDIDCSAPFITCQNSSCQRKKILPIEAKEVWGILLLGVLVLIAAAAGQGGGAIIVPILLMFMDFSPKEAVALSSGIIFFASIFKTAFSFNKKHPKIKHRTMVDHNLVIIFVCTVLLGVLIGTTLSEILPDLVQMVGLILVVLFALIKGWKHSRRIYRKENEIRRNKKKKNNGDENQEEQIDEEEKNNCSNKEEEEFEQNRKRNYEDWEVPEDENVEIGNLNPKKRIALGVANPNKDKIIEKKNDTNSPSTGSTSSFNQDVEVIVTIKNVMNDKIISDIKEKEEKLTEKEIKLQEKIKKIESSNFYYKKFLISFSILILSFLVILLKGGKSMESIIGLEKCSKRDWQINFIYLGLVILLTILADIVVISEKKMKVKAKWNFEKDEKVLCKKQVLELNFFGVVVGIISSIVGIGGGTLLAPILLGMHFEPQVVSFTSVYLILLKNSVAFFALLISGMLPLDYCIVIGLILGVGICLFEKKLGKIVKKTGRQSIVGFMFFGIMIIGFCFVVYTTIHIYKDKRSKDENLLKFKNYCEVK